MMRTSKHFSNVVAVYVVVVRCGHGDPDLIGNGPSTRQVTQWVASAFLGNSKHNVWYKIAGISVAGDGLGVWCTCVPWCTSDTFRH